MLRRSAFREIRSSLGRYIAIIAIIALGVGFFAGLRVTKTDMVKTTDTYVREHGLFDYRLLSTVGYDADDVAALAALDGGMELDLIAVDLQRALAALGEITGETLNEQVIDEVFARFCVGK